MRYRNSLRQAVSVYPLKTGTSFPPSEPRRVKIEKNEIERREDLSGKKLSQERRKIKHCPHKLYFSLCEPATALKSKRAMAGGAMALLDQIRSQCLTASRRYRPHPCLRLCTWKRFLSSFCAASSRGATGRSTSRLCIPGGGQSRSRRRSD